MNIKRFLTYLAYFCLAFAVFAILRFPHHTAGQKISTSVENLFPGLGITMETTVLAFPPGLDCINPVIRFADISPVKLDRLRLSFSFSSLLQTEKELHFSADLSGGKVTGTVSGLSLRQNHFNSLTITTSKIPIKNMVYNTQAMTANLSFDIQGHFYYSNRQEDKTGKGELLLSQFLCPIENDLFKRMEINTLDFQQIEMTFSLEDHQIYIPDFTAKGDILTLSLAGSLTPVNEDLTQLDNWILDIEGNFQPRPEYVSRFAKILSLEQLFKNNARNGIPIQISGPLSSPGVVL